MCVVQLKDRKSAEDLISMFGLNDNSIDQLAILNSVQCSKQWHGHVLRREDGHVLKTLNFGVERGR